VDPRLLRYYERELRHVRDMGAEFAREFPKVAGRLGLDGFECADPYVERLIEAFGFLAARVHLKIDAEFPTFTQHMLELVYPHYLAPTPSMAVVKMAPSAREGALANGFAVPRDTVLRSQTGRTEQTPCEYRTKHDVQLWPITISEVRYSTALGELNEVRSSGLRKAAAILRIQLRTAAGLRFDQLSLDTLPLFIAGGDELAMRLYEQLASSALGIVARIPNRPAPLYKLATEQPCVRPLGFDDADAMLPYGPRSFQGYRLLHEYFAFPQRFMFVELAGLRPLMAATPHDEIELLIVLDREDLALEGAVDATRVLPFCTPAINLFPRNADRVHILDRDNEYHLVADRTRPLDLEVHSVLKVTGFGARADSEREFLPLYSSRDRSPTHAGGYYTINRRPRMLSARQQLQGARSTYIGSELFVALVDAQQGPYRSDLRQLGVQTLCTNRDLALHMPVGRGETDFVMQSGAPVESVRCVAGPSVPRASHASGDVAWRLINHLSLNYLSISDTNGEGATALRDMLGLYSDLGDPAVRKQIQGVKSVRSSAIVRPLPGPGMVAIGRGMEVNVECDETAFQGTGVFMLASVLERFFAKYVSINSFTETVLSTLQRGEIKRWPMTRGQRPVL
jgi:type VI secretion system protein ImpG